jgi:hypothetical protein
MYARIVLSILLANSLALCCTAALGQGKSLDPEPLRLPSGAPFPAPKKDLLRLQNHPNEDAIRRIRGHAWDIFVGLAGDEHPIWESWYTKPDLCLPKCGPNRSGESNQHRLLQNFEVPIQSLSQLQRATSLAKLAGTQVAMAGRSSFEPTESILSDFLADFRKHPQLSSVLFNKEAGDHILNSCLFPPDAFPGKVCPPIQSRSRRIAPFPRGAVVLKTIWAVVHKEGGSISTWKPELWNESHPANFAIDQDTRDVNVNTSQSAGACENRDYSDTEGVPISCFYSYVYDGQALPKLIVGATVPLPGDYLVLLGMHVTTKEIPDWVWATFWWDNRGRSDRHAKGRPECLGAPWNHFLMETTLSRTTPAERDRGPKICFNPFLETKIKNGIISNCLQCHSKAAYGANLGIAYDLGVLGRSGKALASGNPPVPHYYHNRVKTDFLWSLASARDPEIQTILDLLQTLTQLK